MAAESLYDPIPIEALRAVRSRLALEGRTAKDWAIEHGYAPKTVYNVLGGQRRAVRGLSLQIAIKLGLRPDPTSPAAQPGLPSPAPAGRTVAGGAPVASCDRRPVLQLGDPVR